MKISSPLRVIFCGTPEFSLPPLNALINSKHELLAVFTQPDRKAGRGKKLTASPIKQLAQEHGIDVHQPTSLKQPEQQILIEQLKPDLIIVVAYGLIIPQHILDIPTYGCWNIHASLLPRWRGAAPIHRAILNGDSHTGVGIMHMEAGLDTGPVYLQESTAIQDDDTSVTLHDRLSIMGATALMQCIQYLLDDSLPLPVEQNTENVTYAKKLEKHESEIDWSMTAQDIERTIRAFNPWPGTTGLFHSQRYKIWQAKVEIKETQHQPGHIIKANAEALIIQCGKDALSILEIQAAGRKRLPIATFMSNKADWYRGES